MPNDLFDDNEISNTPDHLKGNGICVPDTSNTADGQTVLPAQIYKLNTLDVLSLFSTFYPYQQLLDLINFYPHIHGVRANMVWLPGGVDIHQDNVDCSPFIWVDAQKKWDLSNWNAAYIDRFVKVVTAFGQAKKYLVLSMIDYSTWGITQFPAHYFKNSNNINNYGSDDFRQDHWTASDQDHTKPADEAQALHFYCTTIDNILKYIPKQYLGYIKIDTVNAPFQSLDIGNIWIRWNMQFYKFTQPQNWISLNAVNQFMAYGNVGNAFDVNTGVINIRNCAKAGDLKNIIAGKPHDLYNKVLLWRPDTFGAKDDKGNRLKNLGKNNVTGIKPAAIQGMLKESGCIGIELHNNSVRPNNSRRYTAAEWTACFNTAKTICGAFK